MKSIRTIYRDQKQYNDLIRKYPYNRIEWTKTYLLGLISEVDEVLREINWKKHRKDRHIQPDRVNIALELADLTKYVLSLWEVWDFSAEDMLHYVDLKSRTLYLQTIQERSEVPTDKPIVICDLDGTIGDWKVTFVDWLKSKGIENLVMDENYSLMMDSDLSMLYKEYYDLKEEFESTGQYRNIKLYEDAYPLLTSLKDHYDAYIIAITARPSERYSRIWMDTWIWIEENNLPIDKLIIGSESRILLAHSLRKENMQEVIMLEDNPGLIERGAKSGIRIFAREHPYNRGISATGVRIVKSYKDIPVSEYFPNFSKEE